MENRTWTGAFELACVLLSGAALSACVTSTESAAKGAGDEETLEIYSVDRGVGIANDDGTQLEVRYDDLGAAGPSLGDTVTYRLPGAEVTLPLVTAPSEIAYSDIDGNPGAAPALVLDFSHLSNDQVAAFAALGAEQPAIVDAIGDGRIANPSPSGTSDNRYTACVNNLITRATVDVDEVALVTTTAGTWAGLVWGGVAGAEAAGALGAVLGGPFGAIAGFVLAMGITWAIFHIYAAASCASSTATM